jgi:hypothetical protein
MCIIGVGNKSRRQEDETDKQRQAKAMAKARRKKEQVHNTYPMLHMPLKRPFL